MVWQVRSRVCSCSDPSGVNPFGRWGGVMADDGCWRATAVAATCRQLLVIAPLAILAALLCTLSPGVPRGSLAVVVWVIAIATNYLLAGCIAWRGRLPVWSASRGLATVLTANQAVGGALWGVLPLLAQLDPQDTGRVYQLLFQGTSLTFIGCYLFARLNRTYLAFLCSYWVVVVGYLLHDANLDTLTAVGGILLVLAAALVCQRTMEASLRRSHHLTLRVQFEATHDPLTALLNRPELERSASRLRRDYWLLLCDIERFSVINDRLGHAGGDEVLRQVGAHLRALCGPEDLVARVGPDQFVVLPRRATCEADAMHLGESLVARINACFPNDIATTHLSLRIGVASNRHLDGPGQVLEAAEMAVASLVGADTAAVSVYDSELALAVLAERAMADDLRQTLYAATELGGSSDLLMVAQPIVELATGIAMGVELLARWEHPQRGAVPPTVFVPLAERFGLAVPLGRWALGQAMSIAASWATDPVLATMTISVNVSARHLTQGDLVADVTAALARSAAPPAAVVIELTESASGEDADHVENVMTQLRSMGVGVAIDDFGVGFSSLSYLRRLPATVIKVDREFVVDIITDLSNRAIVRLVCELAAVASRYVVAEGVETPEQAAALLALGVTRAQGWLFARGEALPIVERKLRTGDSLLTSAPVKAA